MASFIPVDTELNNIFSDDGLIFQRFTSLKDCDGKDIYEGDIVLIENEAREIIWGNGTLSWCYKGTSQEHPIADYLDFIGAVVGNALENADLLK